MTKILLLVPLAVIAVSLAPIFKASASKATLDRIQTDKVWTTKQPIVGANIFVEQAQ
jgi:hypothetical protein